jgi:hypothetical protein
MERTNRVTRQNATFIAVLGFAVGLATVIAMHVFG